MQLTHGRKVLVWDSIDTSLAGIVHTWWEDNKVTEPLKAFRRVRWSLHQLRKICNASHLHLPLSQALCSPLVEKLGLEYSKKDSADITQLRTLAVGAAASAEDPA